jgi:hypothetical protein
MTEQSSVNLASFIEGKRQLVKLPKKTKAGGASAAEVKPESTEMQVRSKMNALLEDQADCHQMIRTLESFVECQDLVQLLQEMWDRVDDLYRDMRFAVDQGEEDISTYETWFAEAGQ